MVVFKYIKSAALLHIGLLKRFNVFTKISDITLTVLVSISSSCHVSIHFLSVLSLVPYTSPFDSQIGQKKMKNQFNDENFHWKGKGFFCLFFVFFSVLHHSMWLNMTIFNKIIFIYAILWYHSIKKKQKEYMGLDIIAQFGW